MTRPHALGLLVALAACGGESTPPPPPPKPSLFEPPAEPGAPAGPGDAGTATRPEPAAPAPTALRFDDVSSQWGVSLRHHAGRNPDRWIPEIMSGGVALVDLDRNGALDLFLADGGALAGELPAGAGPRLLLGDGKGGFTEVSEAWGLTPQGYGMGVAAGDVDGDGWVDLYLTTWDGKDRLLHNEAGQGLRDVSEQWGVSPQGWSTSAAFLDLEHDGDLDLYVVRYVDYELGNAIKCWYRSIHIYCTPAMYEALPDRLLRNEGGRFVDASETSGVAAMAAKGLAVTTGDLDDDGDTDLYVADDISRNLLLLNDGTGKLSDEGVVAGVAYSEIGREEASMGASISDADADGRWDVAVTNFQAEPTSLYMRREGGSYRERSDAAGIGASSRARLSFGIEFLDADNDGDEDLITANGHISDNVSTYRETVEFAQPNSLYERVADGRFVDVSEQAGSALERRGVSRGLAVGDIDGDGGLDYVVVDNDGPVQVARNTTSERGHWLSLWLEGGPANRSAVGAVVVATVGDRTLRREVRGASSYLSVSDRRVHLGLGDASQVDEIVITWPGGQEQRLGPQSADAHLHVQQGQAPRAYVPGAEVISP
ncbi:MAG: CRTAC1 family protein [Myxococcales bacterium]|nr:CRTAC1 family protein [Myxococcales bacterium]MCB9714036.1 CRTAC1 family protein [Myxococcales bacterium]